MDEIAKYVSIEEVAEYYTVSVSTVRGWLRKDVIPPTAYLKIGNTYRFRIADVDAALRAKTLSEKTAPASAEAETINPAEPVQMEFDFTFATDKDA
jgi:excisionase family DNA binding protein